MEGRKCAFPPEGKSSYINNLELFCTSSFSYFSHLLIFFNHLYLCRFMDFLSNYLLDFFIVRTMLTYKKTLKSDLIHSKLYIWHACGAAMPCDRKLAYVIPGPLLPGGLEEPGRQQEACRKRLMDIVMQSEITSHLLCLQRMFLHTSFVC